MSAGSAEAALRAAGGGDCRGGRGDGGLGARRLRRRPPARPPRRDQTGRWASACSPTPPSPPATRRRAGGSARVAVVDFDVHHGNGTQEIFDADPTCSMAPAHQFPCYPGTGVGSASAASPATWSTRRWRPGRPAPPFRAAWEERILPALDAFAPELLIVLRRVRRPQGRSARTIAAGNRGFRLDHRATAGAGRRHCGGRLVSVLEGGYDLRRAGGLGGAARADPVARLTQFVSFRRAAPTPDG